MCQLHPGVLVKVILDLLSAKFNGELSVPILLDSSAAFGSIDPSLLVEILYSQESRTTHVPGFPPL